jgi:hypothetical protein
VLHSSPKQSLQEVHSGLMWATTGCDKYTAPKTINKVKNRFSINFLITIDLINVSTNKLNQKKKKKTFASFYLNLCQKGH